jgi:hypothetical protein
LGLARRRVVVIEKQRGGGRNDKARLRRLLSPSALLAPLPTENLAAWAGAALTYSEQ